MRRYFLSVVPTVLCLFSLFLVNCNDAIEQKEAALISALSYQNNIDKTNEVDKIIGEVANQLISEGKAKSVQLDGKLCFIPVAPCTFDQMQISLVNALQQGLGDDWSKYFDAYLEKLNNQILTIQDMPEELSKKIYSSNLSSITTIQDTGILNYACPILNSYESAHAYQKKDSFAFPVPYIGVWVWGITWIRFEYKLPVNVIADIVSVVLFDGNGNPYTWADGTTNLNGKLVPSSKGTSITKTSYSVDSNGVSFDTIRSTKSFGHQQLYISGWTITTYKDVSSDIWSQSF